MGWWRLEMAISAVEFPEMSIVKWTALRDF
jgi:hypothetical protein